LGRRKSIEGNPAMAKMRAMVVRERGGSLAAQRDIPVPGADEILIRVRACGVCHSDMVTVQKLFPFVQYPRIPGHEVVASSMHSARGSRGSKSASGWASAGSEEPAAIAAIAAVTRASPAKTSTS
jgi:cytochrome c553